MTKLGVFFFCCAMQTVLTAIYKMPIEQSDFFIVEPIENGPICELGEGPHWDPKTKILNYVDAFVGDIHRFNTETKVHDKFNTGELSSIVIPIDGKNNQFITTLRNKLVKLDWNTKKIDVLTNVPENERFNDAKADSNGRLWIGTIKEDSKKNIIPLGGSLYKLVDNNLVKMSQNYTISNGMSWNKNDTLMFFNDSEDQKTYAFDFDAINGTISSKRILIDYKTNKDYSEEYPDGMLIDKNDEIWIALYNGSRIIRISSTGQLLASIKVPAIQTTSLTFGGTNFDMLYVTCGSSTNEPSKYPNAGKVFQIKQKLGTIPNDDQQIQGIAPRNVKL